MKRFALYSLCIGFLTIAMSGCGDGDSSGPSKDKCNYAGNQCSADGLTLLKCENGVESTVMPCANGCADGACLSATGCNYTQPKCSDDGTMVLTCSGGQESSQPCANGCLNGACKNNGDACDYEDARCSEDATKVVKCDKGTETVVSSCEYGCTDGECNANPAQNTCDFSGEKCDSQTSTLYKCSGGKEVIVKTCDLGCDGDKCREEACNFDGTQCSGLDVIACVGGEEQVVATCKTKCNKGECEDEEDPTVCDFKGKKCRRNEVVKCDKDQNFEVVETCIGGCTDGACDSVACPETVNPSCFDTHTVLECDASTKQMKKTECPPDKLCANGECFDDSELVSCDFATSCTADKTAIRKCENGKATYEVCPNQTSCDDDSGAPECVSTVTGTKCDELRFNPYCDDNNHAFSCNDGTLKDQNCGTVKKCINGDCVSQKEWKIGDECTIENFPDTCIGNIPVRCIKPAGKKATVTAMKDDCSESGMICGVILDNSVASAGCFEKCTVWGQERNTCTALDETTYQSVYECVLVDHGIGDGRLGYDMEPGTWQKCDIGCKQGKCYDYTEGIEGLGTSCKTAEFSDYCKDAVAVVCDYDSEKKEDVIQAELCDYNEACVVQTVDGRKTADCFKQCKEDDAPVYVCEEKIVLGNSIFESQALTCTSIDGVYVWQSDPDKYDICKNGCAADGKCK